MSKAREHAEYIFERIRSLGVIKYLSGDEEHGGDLSRKATHTHLLDEVLDLNVYLVNHLDHLDDVRERLEDLIIKAERIEDDEIRTALIEAHNILTIGNPEGVEEEERSG